MKDRKELVTSCTIVSATDNADTLVLWKIMRNKSRASVCEYFAFDGECFSRVTHAKTELYNCQPVSFILTADKKIENNDLWKTNCHVSMKVCALSNLLHNPNIHLSHSSSYSSHNLNSHLSYTSLRSYSSSYSSHNPGIRCQSRCYSSHNLNSHLSYTSLRSYSSSYSSHHPNSHLPLIYVLSGMLYSS